MSVAAVFERRLRREGLGSLDYDDGAGGITVGNRGSGKVLDATRATARDEAREKAERRKAVVADFLDRHVFPRGSLEPRALKLYAAGLSFRAIERRTGMGYISVFRLVAKAEKELRRTETQAGTLSHLVTHCEPTTVVLIFSLLTRALDEPDEVRRLIGEARKVPELRALLEPEEVDHG